MSRFLRFVCVENNINQFYSQENSFIPSLILCHVITLDQERERDNEECTGAGEEIDKVQGRGACVSVGVCIWRGPCCVSGIFFLISFF